MHPAFIDSLERLYQMGVDSVVSHGILLAENTMGLSGEQLIALVTLIVTPIVGGVGFFTRWAFGQVDNIRTMANERIAVAEKRETEEKLARKEDRDTHNKRMDVAIEGIATLTRTVQEQSSLMKSTGDGQREELRRISDGVTRIHTQLRIDRDPA